MQNSTMLKKLKLVTYFFVFSATFTFLLVLLLYNAKTDDISFSTAIYRRRGQHQMDNEAYPKPWTLIDLKFQYIINNLLCNNKDATIKPHNSNTSEENSTIFMLILITSHAGDLETREQIRQVLPEKELDRIGMKRLFLLAKPPLKSQNAKYHSIKFEIIQEENDQFSDILMGDFEESYHNLTYKHLMGLQWASRYCSQAKFVLKQDDDVIVDFYQLSKLLRETNFSQKLSDRKAIMGKVLDNYAVIRDPKSKWFVPQSEFSSDIYPAFVSGWAYITTPRVIKDLVKSASQLPYFWIDDVHITGTLRELNRIELIDLDKYFTVYKGQMQCCISTAAHYKSKANQPYWCDFVVGPSNDDLQLMEIFQNHARFCHTTNICLRRPEKESLNSTCVITDKMIVNNFSNPGKIKAKGLWSPVKL